MELIRYLFIYITFLWKNIREEVLERVGITIMKFLLMRKEKTVFRFILVQVRSCLIEKKLVIYLFLCMEVLVF